MTELRCGLRDEKFILKNFWDPLITFSNERSLPKAFQHFNSLVRISASDFNLIN